jgi:hypothetical protein
MAMAFIMYMLIAAVVISMTICSLSEIIYGVAFITSVLIAVVVISMALCSL